MLARPPNRAASTPPSSFALHLYLCHPVFSLPYRRPPLDRVLAAASSYTFPLGRILDFKLTVRNHQHNAHDRGEIAPCSESAHATGVLVPVLQLRECGQDGRGR
ncbi:hypothetical protein HDK64DRAFT_224671, partial [Phyllosticta capitalensis]